jgi:dipeptidyl aminopeptidase/acylaminoacyl peptidase
MIGYLPTGKDDSPVFFDPVKQAAAKRVIGAFPGERVQFVDWSTDFSKMLVQTSGNRDSGSWYVIDTNTLQKVRLGQDRGQIGPDMVGPVSTFQYKAADGLAMNGILTLPPGREAKNLPAIMLPHGGPASEDVEAFDWWAQAFASRGYAVFQPNFRGSTNMGDKFELAGNGEWGRKMQTDISDGLNALAKAGIIDPKRVCIVGASYGGYAALAGVTLQHGIYKCSVAVAGISDVKALEDS